MRPSTPAISQSSETYFLARVAVGAPDASASMVEPVGAKVVQVGSGFYAFRGSSGEMPLSSAQSASAAEGLVVAMVIFDSFKVGVRLEAVVSRAGLRG